MMREKSAVGLPRGHPQSARAALDAAMSEAEWQRQVVEYAELMGWTVYHTHDSRRSLAGFPDLVLLRERTVFVELKRHRGRYSAAQLWFHEQLRKARAEIHLWRPSDWPEVERVLGPAKEGA